MIEMFCYLLIRRLLIRIPNNSAKVYGSMHTNIYIMNTKVNDSILLAILPGLMNFFQRMMQCYVNLNSHRTCGPLTQGLLYATCRYACVPQLFFPSRLVSCWTAQTN